MNSIPSNELYQVADSLHRRGYNVDEITLQLREKGAPENLLTEIVEQLKNLRLTRKRNTGFICCGIGVAMLVIGCMLTLLLYNSGNIRFVMYGLTTIGVILSMKGLADIFGW